MRSEEERVLPEREEDGWSPPEQLLAGVAQLLGTAASWRSAPGAPAGNHAELIDVVPASRGERIEPSGCGHAGSDTDTDLSAVLEVRLLLPSGRVQVERPPAVAAGPRAPLWSAIWAGQGFAHDG